MFVMHSCLITAGINPIVKKGWQNQSVILSTSVQLRADWDTNKFLNNSGGTIDGKGNFTQCWTSGWFWGISAIMGCQNKWNLTGSNADQAVLCPSQISRRSMRKTTRCSPHSWVVLPLAVAWPSLTRRKTTSVLNNDSYRVTMLVSHHLMTKLFSLWDFCYLKESVRARKVEM